ncbi:MAG: UPF0280 family protein [Candidatus Omnitrophota bacterium]
MKYGKYQKRFYRDLVKAEGLYLTHIIAKESDLQVLTNKRLDTRFLEERLRMYRYDIENYINKDYRFLISLKPIEVELNASEIVKEMASQAKKVNVGPMATVAGAIAEFLGRDLLKKGYQDVIIENGGGIFLKTRKARRIGIYAGRSKLWNKLKIKIKPKDTPLGICASSGTIGHSLSFGIADCVIVLSKHAALADAVAAATANRVQSKDDLQKAVDFAKSIRGVIGVAVILKNNLINWGEIEFAS